MSSTSQRNAAIKNFFSTCDPYYRKHDLSIRYVILISNKTSIVQENYNEIKDKCQNNIRQHGLKNPKNHAFNLTFPIQPQWGTADAEIKNPPGGSQGLSKVPSF